MAEHGTLCGRGASKQRAAHGRCVCCRAPGVSQPPRCRAPCLSRCTGEVYVGCQAGSHRRPFPFPFSPGLHGAAEPCPAEERLPESGPRPAGRAAPASGRRPGGCSLVNLRVLLNCRFAGAARSFGFVCTAASRRQSQPNFVGVLICLPAHVQWGSAMVEQTVRAREDRQTWAAVNPLLRV